MFSRWFNITKGQAISEWEYYISTGSETETSGIPPSSSCEPGLKSRVSRFLMKGRMQSFTKGSKACRGTSGAQTSNRPEVLLKLQTLLTLLTLERFFSKNRDGNDSSRQEQLGEFECCGEFFCLLYPLVTGSFLIRISKNKKSASNILADQGHSMGTIWHIF